MEGIRNFTRDEPIRRTPTMEEFRQMVADLRSQVYNARSKPTADFVEFLGLSGPSNAEAVNLRWGHFRFAYFESGKVDWLNTRSPLVVCYRIVRHAWDSPPFEIAPPAELREGGAGQRADC